ncbi:MAG TPA: hypothetical protein VF517_08530 [Thermoleophilaceae bacterium]|jgi:hypothetical protein
MAKRPLIVVGVMAAFALVPGSAGAAVGDYSCDIASLQVQNEFDNGSSGTFTATGSGQCWTSDPTKKVATQFSASGTYRAQKCSLISVTQPSYLVLNGTLTITPSGQTAGSTGMTISTADVVTANHSAGTITLASGQTGPVQVDYASPVLGVIARCGGDPFSPEYSGTFLAT